MLFRSNNEQLQTSFKSVRTETPFWTCQLLSAAFCRTQHVSQVVSQ